MPYDVTIKVVPGQTVAGLTVRTNLPSIGNAVAQAFVTVAGAIAAAGEVPSGPPFIVYHQVIDEHTDGDIEICIPVPPGSTAPPGDVVWKQLPGGVVASTTHRGPYAEIRLAYDTVIGWIEDHGHTVTGPPREVYLNDPQLVTPDDLLTEVQFPVDASS